MAGPIGRPDRDRCDVLIVGAGPVGLSLALSLRGAGLDVRLVERQPAGQLADPAYDGREIALSLRSVDILKRLGAWAHVEDQEIVPLRSAKVIDGGWDTALDLEAAAVGEDELGYFLSNCVIRRALYAEHMANGEAELLDEEEVVGLRPGLTGGVVTLAGGREIHAALIVGADTRLSATREMAGIGAHKHDFGRTMIVSKVGVEIPHDGVALEWFLPGGAVAILPLGDRQVSVVQTFASEQAKRQLSLDIETYLDRASHRLENRFGRMTALSKRFSYPLVGVYARKFAKPGFALVGDAAVGMHPITAHGFNLGVQGQSVLAGHLRRASACGRRLGDPRVLAAYEREHRRLSAGMYWSTLAIAELYARESPPAKIARRALLGAGRLVSPARQMIMRTLTQPLPAQ